MKLWKIGLVIAVMCIGGVDASVARTWYVELDGSGDYTDIQPAVDASTAGDTIRVGPGRFDTFHPCVAPGWTEEAIVSVNQDNLTFIGSGKDVTILGTSTWYGSSSADPKVFCSVDPFTCRIKDMTIENVEQGAYWWGGNLVVEGCMIRGAHNDFMGLVLSLTEGAVRNCEFEIDNAGKGCLLHSASQGFTIQNCVFRGYGFGVQAVNGSKNITISGSEFDDLYVGIWYANNSTGSITNCILRRTSYSGIQVTDYSNTVLDGVFIDGAETGVAVAGSAVLTGSNVIIENTTAEGMLVWAQARVTLNNSHILPASGLGIRVFGYTSNRVVLDMTGNYWGVTDSDSIAAMIEDGTDDPSVLCTVDYVPFSGGPVPTQSTNWGSVKSMFR